MIEMPTRLDKSELSRVFKARGAWNADTVVIDGRSYARHELQFVAIIASFSLLSRRYEGVLRFQPGSPASDDCADYTLNDLIPLA